MSPQDDNRVTEAGYLGISALSDDTIDTDDLYEALINPHGGQGSAGAGPTPGGMMIPPMMGMGMGGGGSAGGGGGGFTMPAASTGMRAPAGVTGAGGAGLGATPTPGGPGGGAAPVGGGGDVDLGSWAGGATAAGVEAPVADDALPAPAAGVADAASGTAGGGTPEPRPPVEPTAHSGDAISSRAQVWQEVAGMWPGVATELDGLAGKGLDLFGLCHEAEHGFNEAQQWLTRRAKEAAGASNAMCDVLVDARKAWEATEQANTDQANQINRELQR